MCHDTNFVLIVNKSRDVLRKLKVLKSQNKQTNQKHETSSILFVNRMDMNF